MIWVGVAIGFGVCLVVVLVIGATMARGMGDVGLLPDEPDERTPVARMVDRIDPDPAHERHGGAIYVPRHPFS